MSKQVTIKDVAALAGVSVGTVSMVLNNSPKISMPTRDLVQQAVEKLDYKRNPYARSLSLSSSDLIGFLVTDLSNPFFGVMTGFLQKEVTDRGKSLMVGLTQESITQEKILVEKVLDHGADGLIIVPVAENDPDLSHLYKLANKKFPLVMISGYYQGFPGNCVMTDLAKGSYDLTKHLLETGHVSVTLISGLPQLVPSQERIKGFVQAHTEKGIRVSSQQIVTAGSLNFEGGFEVTKRIIKNGRPDAIIAINDVLAMGALSCLKTMNIAVPEEISIAGYDDLSFSGILETPLTTIRQPIHQMCTQAVDMLFELMNGGHSVKTPVLLEPNLVLRKSTSPR